MKRNCLQNLLLAYVFACSAIVAQSQSVGINNSGAQPNASAILDVNSTTKGMLIPRMTTVQRAAIVNPANGLMLYDTDMKGFWFYNGTAWAAIGASQTGLWLANGNDIYNSNSGKVAIGVKTADAAAVLTVQANEIGISQQSPDGTAKIGFYTKAGTAYLQTHNNTPLNFSTNNGSSQMIILTNGNIGIGTVTPTANLELNGSLKIAGGNTSPGVGRVLTSDASGNATWQSSGSVPKVGFSVFGAAASGLNKLTANQWSKVHFNAESYDVASNYTLYNQVPSSTFTVPSAGFYQFNVMVSLLNSGLNVHDAGGIRLMLERGGASSTLAENYMIFNTAVLESNSFSIAGAFSLLAGDKIWVEVKAQTSYPYFYIDSYYPNNLFSGFRVH